MPILLLVLLAIALLIALNIFLKSKPKDLVRNFRLYGAWGLILGAGFMAVLGRLAAAVPLAGIGGSMLFKHFSMKRRASPFGEPEAGGQTSSVSTDFLEMELDHAAGEIDGRVLKGAYANRTLRELDTAQLVELFAEIGHDPKSRSLLEAYLDRRNPGWREDLNGNTGAGHGGAAGTGPMRKEEAYDILGLAPGASAADIRAAHRRLMKAVHPDQGGSTLLAAKINEAKDCLLSGHD